MENQTRNNISTPNKQLNREQINVHSMPKKFVEVTQKTGRLSKGSQGGKGKKLALLAVVLIFVIVLVIGGVWFYLDTNKDDVANNTIVNTQRRQNTNTNDNQNTNQNTNDNTNDDQMDDNTNDNDFEINDNQNTNDNTNDDQMDDNTNDDNQTNLDSDNDGLSFEEEIMYGTDPDQADTDRDGYKDGQEITSLYNPLAPYEGLFISGLVKRFIASNEGYSFLRPSSWTAKISGSSSKNIVVLPDSESGQSFTIDVVENQSAYTLPQALEAMSDTLGASSNYQNYSLSGVAAYRSLDGKKVIAINRGLIFVISYETGPFGNSLFTNTFEMLLNGFEWLEQ